MTVNSVLTTSEVARQLNVTTAAVRQWCKAGIGPRHIRTPGGRIRFRKRDVVEWLESLDSENSMESSARTGGKNPDAKEL